MSRWLSSSGLALLLATGASAQTGQVSPDFTLRIWAYFDATALEEFGGRVQAYVELRRKAAEGLPPRRVTRDPAELERAEAALAERIRAARATARRGDIFRPPIESGIKRVLVLEVDSATLALMKEDNPGEFPLQVNGSYPEGLALSTVPPNILAMLPRLADDLEYRFVGRHLILRDTRANVVVDHIPYAFECMDCPELIQGIQDEGTESK